MKKSAITLIAIMMMTAMVCRVGAVPVLGETWTLQGTGWGTATLLGSDPSPAGVSMTNPNATSMMMTFAAGGASPYASISSANAYFTGNFSGFGNNLQVTYTFNALDVAPNPVGGLQMYFASGTDIWWANNITTPLSTGSGTYSFLIGQASDWTADIFNGATPWATAWGAVSSFGFAVNGPNQLSQQRYTFSDIQFSEYVSVPEPETVWMLLLVIVSLGVTFRARLATLVREYRARA